MCHQVIEVYDKCRCLYYQHPFSHCPRYGTRGHKFLQRTIYVGYTCVDHTTPEIMRSSNLPSTASPSPQRGVESSGSLETSKGTKRIRWTISEDHTEDKKVVKRRYLAHEGTRSSKRPRLSTSGSTLAFAASKTVDYPTFQEAPLVESPGSGGFRTIGVRQPAAITNTNPESA